MRALDTNVLARYVLRDEPDQATRAANLIREPFFVSHTVLLELAWLLASRYRVSRADLAATLQDLLSLSNMIVADRARVCWAVDRFAAGADLADMLHLVTAGPADVFVSFESRLARQAGPGSPIPIEQPPA